MPVSTAVPSSTPSKDRVPIYSFEWASSKIDLAFKSHPRAWQIFSPILGLSRRQLAYLLACNAPEWPVIRSIVHQISKWLAQQEKIAGRDAMEGFSTENLLSSIKILVCKIDHSDLRIYLTGRISSLILKKQSKQGDPDPKGEGSHLIADPLEDADER